MKTRLSSILLLAFSTFFIAHSSGDDSLIKRTAKSKIEGVEVEVTMPAVVKNGDNIGVVIKLTNNSDDPVSLPHINDVYELHIVVMDSHYEPVWLTPRGEDTIHILPMHMDRHIIVAPGESHEWKISLEKYFMLKPGRYTVSLPLFPNYVFPLSLMKLEVK